MFAKLLTKVKNTTRIKSVVTAKPHKNLIFLPMAAALHRYSVQGGFSFYQISKGEKNVQNNQHIMPIYCSRLSYYMVGV